MNKETEDTLLIFSSMHILQCCFCILTLKNIFRFPYGRNSITNAGEKGPVENFFLNSYSLIMYYNIPSLIIPWSLTMLG